MQEYNIYNAMIILFKCTFPYENQKYNIVGKRRTESFFRRYLVINNKLVYSQVNSPYSQVVKYVKNKMRYPHGNS